MSQASLALGAALGLAGAALFATAGVRTWRRARATASPPLRAFAVFWLAAGAYLGLNAMWIVAWLAGLDALPVSIAILEAKVAAVCASFAGLVCYLLAIYAGRRRLVLPVGAAYAGLLLAMETYYAWRAPVGQHASLASLGLDYLRPQQTLVWDALLVLLFVPPIVATLAYASLHRLGADPAARRRIRWTAASLLLFFAPDLVGWLAGRWTGWDVVELALALCAGVGMLLATRAPVGSAPPRPRDEGLEARARQLI